jgi:hypothetical protein
MATQKAFQWSKLYAEILESARRIAHDRYENHLERILGEFDTRIPVGVEEFIRGDSYIFMIGPLEGPTFEREDGETRSTSQLFNWLNEGTSIKHIKIIGNYNRESFPSSLVTTSQDNSGIKIIPSKKFESDGIEPRKWLDLLEERYRDELPAKVNATIIKSIKI